MTDVQKGPVTNLYINFQQSDFVKQDYVGQLDWNPSWGMADKQLRRRQTAGDASRR